MGFVGQPNTGKSSVFNKITGLRQHVGNWPGKTIEQKTGKTIHNDQIIYCVDLPGAYSLSSNSLEERITRNFILNDKPDVIVVVIDASQLERSSYILTEIIDLKIPYVVALNMMDVATNMNFIVDFKKMESKVKAPIVPLVASKGKGIDKLLDAILNTKDVSSAKPTIYQDEVALVLDKITQISENANLHNYPYFWSAVKFLEDDSEINKYYQLNLPDIDWSKISDLRENLDNSRILIAGQRYDWLSKLINETVQKPKLEELALKRVKFDQFATHPIYGYLIATVIIVLGFIIAFAIGGIFATLIMTFIPPLISYTNILLVSWPIWLSGAISYGLITGVGIGLAMGCMVISLSFVLGTLEDIGYMSRLGYLFNKFTRKIGLHGKSFMPMFMSVVCNVSGIVGSRVMDSWKQRMLVLVMSSIIPCAALIPIIGFMVLQFFTPAESIIIYFALVFATIFHLVITAKLLGATFLKGKQTGLIMELPPYHRPNWKSIFTFVIKKGQKFVKEAVTIIAIASTIIWLLSYFPGRGIDNSYLASFGNFFSPISRLMGMDWLLFTSWITAAITKETALSTMAVLYGITAPEGTSIMSMMLDVMRGGSEHIGLGAAVHGAVSKASALAFVFAVYFSIPCIAAVGVVYSETGSLKWTFGTALYYTLASFVYGVIAFNIGLLIF